MRLRSAEAFAGQLAVHVNHLNRALRQVTNKTTTQLIAGRLVQEAYALLRHTSWPARPCGRFDFHKHRFEAGKPPGQGQRLFCSINNDCFMSSPKSWFVTGASQGLGLALVQRLLREGHRVAATSRRLSSLTEAVGTASCR